MPKQLCALVLILFSNVCKRNAVLAWIISKAAENCYSLLTNLVIHCLGIFIT